MNGPGFWMDETTGVLRPAVEAYLRDEPLTPSQIAALRAYLRQWIAYPWWCGDVEGLRGTIDTLTSREALHSWIDRAADEGMDPL